MEYENRLKQIQILLLESYKGAKAHHLLKCINCNHEWYATPISKLQNHKRYGHNGCPKCNELRQQIRYENTLNKNLEALRHKGFELLNELTVGMMNQDIKVKVKNTRCDHVFEITPKNLLSRHVECSVCGPSKRAANTITKWSKANSEEWQKTATEWQKYKKEVMSLTRQTYKKHKDRLNPNNLPRGVAGTPGAYHLDHIYSVRFCYKFNIPAIYCADVENLRLIDWYPNVSKGAKCATEEVSEAFKNKIMSLINC